jgi:hypothetical protein
MYIRWRHYWLMCFLRWRMHRRLVLFRFVRRRRSVMFLRRRGVMMLGMVVMVVVGRYVMMMSWNMVRAVFRSMVGWMMMLGRVVCWMMMLRRMVRRMVMLRGVDCRLMVFRRMVDYRHRLMVFWWCGRDMFGCDMLGCGCAYLSIGAGVTWLSGRSVRLMSFWNVRRERFSRR